MYSKVVAIVPSAHFSYPLLFLRHSTMDRAAIRNRASVKRADSLLYTVEVGQGTQFAQVTFLVGTKDARSPRCSCLLTEAQPPLPGALIDTSRKYVPRVRN